MDTYSFPLFTKLVAHTKPYQQFPLIQVILPVINKGVTKLVPSVKREVYYKSKTCVYSLKMLVCTKETLKKKSTLCVFHGVVNITFV